MANKLHEYDRIIQAQDGDKFALEQVIKDNEGLVKTIIYKFSAYYEYDDLYQVGMIGLIKAIHKFDVSLNFRFSTYAFPLILGEVKRFIRDNQPVKISREIKVLSYKIEKMRTKLTIDLNREPTIEEISIALEVDVQKVLEALEASSSLIYFDQELSADGEKTMTLHDVLAARTNDNWFDNILVKMEIEKLSEMEKMILHMRYRLDMNQSVIAERLGISQVQVSRLEKKIIAKLQKKLQKA